ncbi:MAG: 3-methyl-2-oxobutanoate hydroxymethyltransferase [Phormidium sp. GEM2.Bin31]|nr:MAG: 3-methyl-2-oxobutanoate hydroxymethyltransferase [Phormidium sp. GEM2.Bin31]
MAVTPRTLARWKQEKRPLVALTAWDYAIAKVLDEAGVDLILVGDSLAMVALGYETTLPLTLEEMLHHAKAVRRGVKQALLVVDLPFLTYQESPQQALHSAGRVLKETGAAAVKLEGGHPEMSQIVAKLVRAGIPVMGHVGLTPQSVHQLGYRKQGTTDAEAERILTEALALEAAGAFAVVLEHIESQLAETVTAKLTIPTIGIGAGAGCDGQILVTHDLLGWSDRQPPFAKVYANLRETIQQAIQQYSDEVRSHPLFSSEPSGDQEKTI